MSAMQENEQLWEAEAAPAVLGLIPILGLVIWLTDGFWPRWDKGRRALHDKLVRSVVVAAR